MIYIHDLNATFLQIGPLSLHWYGLMYALGFGCGYFYLRWQITQGRVALSLEQLDSLLFAVFLGVLLGGRTGHFLFYEQTALLADPLSFLRVWEGGMSFHGGLLGVLVALLWAARSFKVRWLQLTDAIAAPAALGLFFGRIGNFINGELWGRPTDADWGVIFPLAGDGLARHPSQLYEAGYSLFMAAVLFVLAQKHPRVGQLSFVFLALYGLFRTLVEIYFRAPIAGEIAGLPVGALYSLPLFFVGIAALAYLNIQKKSGSL